MPERVYDQERFEGSVAVLLLPFLAQVGKEETRRANHRQYNECGSDKLIRILRIYPERSVHQRIPVLQLQVGIPEHGI